jgi:hypothetical protein
VKQNGIFAGSAQLRHSTIQMTASHYTDARQRAVVSGGMKVVESWRFEILSSSVGFSSGASL